MLIRDLYIIKRRKNKIRLKELAKYIGCSISLLSRYENYDIEMSDAKEYLYKQYIDNYRK